LLAGCSCDGDPVGTGRDDGGGGGGDRDGAVPTGADGSTGRDGSGAGGLDGSAEACGDLIATLRDFRSDHPDMEGNIADDRGLVQTDLGADGKPVFAPAGATSTVSGSVSFDQWYRNVDGVNMAFSQPIPLAETSPGVFVYDNSSFFPLDGMGFPDEGLGHNFHFTTEIRATFRYRGGEVFTFRGDDDVFVFVNRKLALDLGGVHGAQTGTIDFDAQAAALGITVGSTYSLDVFHAERHTSESNFRIETSIECFILH
jgi:fibro-slime domain-containing protein